MVEYEDECVDCGKPCLDSCPYKRAPHFICDDCGDEAKLYKFDGEELCEVCVLDRLDIVEGSE